MLCDNEGNELFVGFADHIASVDLSKYNSIYNRDPTYKYTPSIWGSTNSAAPVLNNGDAATSGKFQGPINFYVFQGTPTFGFISEPSEHRIRMVNRLKNYVEPFAGSGLIAPLTAPSYTPATSVSIGTPHTFATTYYNTLIADSSHNVIILMGGYVFPYVKGYLTVDSVNGDTGDGFAITSATYAMPTQIYAYFMSRIEFFHIVTEDCNIRELNFATGKVTRVAGNGCVADPAHTGSDDTNEWEGSGSAIAATAALLEYPNIAGKFCFLNL